MQAIGHVMARYLGRPAAFIHTVLRFQTEFRPVVLAGTVCNLEEFPLPDVRALTPEARFPRRVLRRLDAIVHGYARTFESELVRAASASGCAALHAHFGWIGARALRPVRRLGLPLITTFYGRDLSNSYGHSYAALFREGTLFVCEGPAMANHLHEVGCPREKVRIVRIGIDLDRLPFEVPRRSEPFIVLQCARLVEKKGVDLSIRAFAAARSELPTRSELWVVGDGELRGECEALAGELGVAADVRMFGEVSHGSYRKLARQAHVCLQPSRTAADGDSEGGAPTVILEMQAMGVPVVATRHADIPWVVPDPEALTAEEDVDGLGAALVNVASIGDSAYRERTECARAFVTRKHDARIVARDLAGVYRESIAISDAHRLPA